MTYSVTDHLIIESSKYDSINPTILQDFLNIFQNIKTLELHLLIEQDGEEELKIHLPKLIYLRIKHSSDLRYFRGLTSISKIYIE
jgi:hypothetical protein